MKKFFHRYGPALVVGAVILALYFLLRGQGVVSAEVSNPTGEATNQDFSVEGPVPGDFTTPGYMRWNNSPVTFNNITPDLAPKKDCCEACAHDCTKCTTFGNGPSGGCLASTPVKQATALTPIIHYAATNIASFNNGF